MAYSQQTWTDNVTPVDAAHMTHIEAGIAAVDAASLPQPVVNGQWIKGVGGAAVWSPIAVADVAGAQATSQKGAANGYASLDASGKVPAAQLPASAAVAVSGRVNADGSVAYGYHFTCSHTSQGNYTVTLATAMSGWATIVASPGGQSIVCGVSVVDSTHFNVYMTTPSTWIDSSFYFIAIDSYYFPNP